MRYVVEYRNKSGDARKRVFENLEHAIKWATSRDRAILSVYRPYYAGSGCEGYDFVECVAFSQGKVLVD